MFFLVFPGCFKGIVSYHKAEGSFAFLQIKLIITFYIIFKDFNIYYYYHYQILTSVGVVRHGIIFFLMFLLQSTVITYSATTSFPSLTRILSEYKCEEAK